MVNSSGSSDWSWMDAIQMAMPVFVRLGVLYDDDDAYFEKMHDLYAYTKNNLWHVPKYGAPSDAVRIHESASKTGRYFFASHSIYSNAPAISAPITSTSARDK